MAVLLIAGAVLVFFLIFWPQSWVKKVMARHGVHRHDFPGTGAELARYLLDQAGLEQVTVEKIMAGDHYSPLDKAVRLSADNYDGKSITAVAVAAHEVGHAVQDAEGFKPLMVRQHLVGSLIQVEQMGRIALLLIPILIALTRAPSLLLVELLLALVVLGAPILLHLFTLPTEYDASFNRALPFLKNHLPAEDMPAAAQVLKAAALTYVSGALLSLVNVARWFRLLRF